MPEKIRPGDHYETGADDQSDNDKERFELLRNNTKAAIFVCDCCFHRGRFTTEQAAFDHEALSAKRSY